MPSRTLLELPILTKLHILDYLGLPDLFSFSLVSSHTKDLVKALNRKVEYCYWWIDIHDTHNIVLPTFDLEIVKSGFEFLPDNQEYEQMHFNDHIYPIEHGNYRWYVVDPFKSERYYMDILEQFSDYILDIFRVQNFKLKAISEMDYLNLFVWKHTKKFEYFHLCADILKPDQMKFVLEQLTVKEYWLMETCEDVCEITGPLTMESMLVENADWLTLETALGMTCKRFVILDDSFSISHSNAFIKAWITGNCLRNLEKFEVRHFLGEEDVEVLEELFEGINVYQWGQRPMEWEKMDVSVGRDVRRVDGTWATVLIWPVIQIYVWQPQFLM